MVTLIYGGKGSGKTKRIIDAANACLSDGDVVFLTDNSKSLDIDNNIRFINVKEFGIKCERSLIAFIKGLIAANADNNRIFIDGIGRILEKNADELEEMMTRIEKVSDAYKVDFTLTVSTPELPEFMKKYS